MVGGGAQQFREVRSGSSSRARTTKASLVLWNRLRVGWVLTVMEPQAQLTLVVLEEGAVWPEWHAACRFSADESPTGDAAPPAVMAIAQSQGEAESHFVERVSNRLEALPIELGKQRARLAHVVLSAADVLESRVSRRVELAKRLAQVCVGHEARFVLAAPPGCSPQAQRDLFALAGGLCEVLGSACDVSVSFGPVETQSHTRLRAVRPAELETPQAGVELLDFPEEIEGVSGGTRCAAIH